MSVPNFLQSQPYIKVFSADFPEGFTMGPGTSFPFVTGVTISQEGTDGNINEACTMDITLDMPYEEGVKLLNGEYGGILIGSRNVVSVQLRYNGQKDLATGWYTGLMTTGGNGLVLSPEGLSGAFRVMPNNSAVSEYNVSRDSRFESLSLSEKLDECLNAIGYSTVTYREGVREEIDAKENPPVFNGMQTYQRVVQRILSETGTAMTVGDMITQNPVRAEAGRTSAVVYRPSDSFSEQPQIVFAMRRKIGGNVWPIIAWNPDAESTTQAWLSSSPATATVAALAINADGLLVTGVANPASAGTPTTTTSDTQAPSGEGESEIAGQATDAPVDQAGDASAVQSGMSVSEFGESAVNVFGRQVRRFVSELLVGPDSAAEEAVNYLIGVRNGASMKASVVVPGCPFVTCGSMVQTVGLGDGFSMNWQVQQATHAWNLGDWQSTYALVANMRESSGGEAAEPAPVENDGEAGS